MRTSHALSAPGMPDEWMALATSPRKKKCEECSMPLRTNGTAMPRYSALMFFGMGRLFCTCTFTVSSGWLTCR